MYDDHCFVPAVLMLQLFGHCPFRGAYIAMQNLYSVLEYLQNSVCRSKKSVQHDAS